MPRLAAGDADPGVDMLAGFSAPELVAADNHLDDAGFADEDAQRVEWEAQHARRVMEATTEGVLIISAGGTCEYVNDAAQRLLGWSRDEIVGQDIHALVHPAGEHPCVFAQPFQTALACSQAEVFRTARGGLLPVDATASPSLANGQVESVVCMFNDATARVRAEQEQAELLAAKEAAVARLEELNAQQRDFVSTVSHELRTPLTSIMGFLDLVLEDPGLPQEVRENLDVVDRNAKRLLAQVEALLLVSRIESGKITAQLVPVDPMAVITDTTTTVAPQAASKGVQVKVSAGADVGWVNADPNQLDRVMLNLLSNAIKFTPDGGQVEVTVHRAGQWVQVQVRDTGMGIPAAEQHRLFEKFFRSTISQKRATPGTGLGLTIVKAIVQEHGGQVRVVSEEGVGTAGASTLPRLHPPPQTKARGGRDGRLRPAPAASGGARRSWPGPKAYAASGAASASRRVPLPHEHTGGCSERSA